MRGFAVIFLMVMMLALLAPMTAMAGGMGDGPVLAITMEHWSNVVTTQANIGPEQPRPHKGKTTVIYNHGVMTYSTATTSAVFGDKMTYMRPRTAQATKAGGAAIFASGKQMPSPFKSIAI